MLVIDPTTTDRAMSYELFINAPMPMVTIHKTIEITKLVRFSKRKKLKLNMLLNYCIGFVASQIKEFKLIPVEKKLVQYDRIGVSVIVDNKEGGINSCSIPFSEDLQKFNEDYLSLTNKVRESCENYDLLSLGRHRYLSSKLTVYATCIAGCLTILFYVGEGMTISSCRQRLL